MSVENQRYQIEILEYAVNQSIDRLLPKNCKDALDVILCQSNEVVWRVAAEIYSKSGHQVDFVFVKDILNLRIEPLKRKIAEEERQRAIREAEEAVIRAELEAKRFEQEIEEKRLIKEHENDEFQKLRELKEKYPDIDLNNYKEFDVFIKIKNMVVEQGTEYLELSQFKLNTIFNEFKYVDWSKVKMGLASQGEWKCIDTVELILEIEEEFDIEISEEEYEALLSWNVDQLVNLIVQKLD